MLYCQICSVSLYQIFPHCLINGTIFGKKKLLDLKYLFWFSVQLVSEIFLIQRRNLRDMTINVYWSSYKVVFILFKILWNLNFVLTFSKNTQMSDLMKLRPVGSWWDLLNKDRPTWCHFALFHYSMLNIFQMLVHPSSEACDLFVELFHGLYCSGSMCVGVTVWFGWGGVVSLGRLKPIFIQLSRWCTVQLT